MSEPIKKIAALLPFTPAEWDEMQAEAEPNREAVARANLPYIHTAGSR